jgi:hypothetical protein
MYEQILLFNCEKDGKRDEEGENIIIQIEGKEEKFYLFSLVKISKRIYIV